MLRSIVTTISVLGSLCALGLTSCSSDAPSGPSGPPGGAVKGPLDTHCAGRPPQATSMAFCQRGDGGGSEGGGGTGGALPTGDDYGPTNYGTEADDDDCKYHIAWSSTPIYENTDITFTVTATRNTDGKPATGSLSLIEGSLNDIEPLPNSDQVATEDPPGSGTYVIGPVQFDAAGRWVVRFHFFEQCIDLAEESPHAHVAFYVDVP